MAITVKHLKVSAIPDSGDDSLIEPSDWNADHELTGTIPVANGGTGAATLTGYVKGNGTSAMTAASTIPNTDITGLGTASTKDAGAALGVATLDAGGKVPVSELPAAVLGALSYQGTWNASTNTPTLTSSTGTKGYYYVVDVAGNTDLNGITDWLVGDWAVFNGSIWQKVDNTDAGGDVVGPSSATDNAVARFDSTTGKLIQNSVVTVSDTGAIAGATTITNLDYLDFDTGYNTTLTAGQLGWNGNDTLGLGMIGGNVVQHIGEDTFYYVKASATITKGQVIMFTGALGASGVILAAPSTGVTNPNYIMGIAAESIANNAFGLIQAFGVLRSVNTQGFADGDVVYYDSAVTGGYTATYPTSGPIVIVGAVVNGGSAGGGVLQIRVSVTQRMTASTGISVSQNGTGTTITNTAPDQTVVLTAGTGISTSGTYPSFTITNTAPSLGGTVTSVSGTGSYGGLSLSGTVTSSGNITLGGTPTGTWPIDVSGNSATVSNGVYTTGSYADPTWITSLAGSKITGTIDGGSF